MTESRPPAPRMFSNVQIVFSAILAISLLLAISFSGRIAAGHKVEAERDNLLNQIATLRAEATALKGQYDYVNSDAFIETWTHGEGKMVKPGEVLVVPVPGQVTPQPTPTPLPPELAASPTPETQSWVLWWRLFFDSPPPQ